MSSNLPVGNDCDDVLSVCFRNEGRNSILTVNAGSSQGTKLRPGQERVYSVPAGCALQKNFKLKFEYENQNPILSDGSRAPTTPTGTSADALHLCITTEMYYIK
jgi:hypothetical protein